MSLPQMGDRPTTIKNVKRQANRIRKAHGVPHNKALDIAAVEAGFANWKHFLNVQNSLMPKFLTTTTKVVVPATVDFNVIFKGKTSRPNKKMPIEVHKKIGALLKEIIGKSKLRKSVCGPLEKVRCELDDWVQSEYTSHEELSNEVFFSLYYKEEVTLIKKISVTEHDDFTKNINEVKQLLEKSYPPCKPLQKMFERLEAAIVALNIWLDRCEGKPSLVGIDRDAPFGKVKRIPRGTLVRVKSSRRLAVVLEQDVSGAVKVCEQSGECLYARQEISICSDQRTRGYRPMRFYLPYGKWTCEDGTEVLFNRDYKPLWVKTVDGKVDHVDPRVWVKFKKQEWFYGDGSQPWRNKKTLKACTEMLESWNVNDLSPRALDWFLNALENGGDVKPKSDSSIPLIS